MFGLTLITTLRFKALKYRLRGAEADNERLREELQWSNSRRLVLEDVNAELRHERSASRVGIQPREQAARQQAAVVAQVRDQHETRDNYIPVGLWSANPALDAAAPMVPGPSFTTGGGGDYAGAGATGSWSEPAAAAAPACESSASSISDNTTPSDGGSCSPSGD